jgi:hypothetical protein
VKNYRTGADRAGFELLRTAAGMKLQGDRNVELTVRPQSLVELLPFTPAAAPGDRQTLPRMIASDCTARSCVYTFAGRSGSEHVLRYRYQGEEASMTLRFPASNNEFSALRFAIP